MKSGSYIRICLVIVWGIFSIWKSSLAQTLTIQEVLASFRQDSLYQQGASDYLWAESHKWKGGWLQKLEFRTETEEFNLNRQEYTLRFSPRGIRESRLRNISRQEETRSLNLAQQKLQAELLEVRYRTIIQIYLQNQLQTLAIQQRQVLKEVIRLLALEYVEGKWDPVDLAKTETELMELELVQEKSIQVQRRANQKITDWTGINAAIDFGQDSLIFIPMIRSVISQYAQSQLVYLPGIQRATLKRDDAFFDWEMEKAQQNRWLDFFQARLRGGSDLTFSPEVSIGLGLNLPLLRENKNERFLQEIQWRSAEAELNQTQWESASKEFRFREELKDLINRWQLFKEKAANGHTRKLYTQVSQIPGEKPLTLVQIKEQLLKQEQLLLEVETQVYNAYLQWLAASGLLAEDVPRNYLSVEREVLIRK